jgi:hypothetical protein
MMGRNRGQRDHRQCRTGREHRCRRDADQDKRRGPGDDVHPLDLLNDQEVFGPIAHQRRDQQRLSRPAKAVGTQRRPRILQARVGHGVDAVLGKVTGGETRTHRPDDLAVLYHRDPEIEADPGGQRDQSADPNSALERRPVFQCGVRHVRSLQQITNPPQRLHVGCGNDNAGGNVRNHTTYFYMKFISLTSIFTSP